MLLGMFTNTDLGQGLSLAVGKPVAAFALIP
jgi:hypothetical protein